MHGHLVHQVDVDSAFLNTPLKEEIFMRLPWESNLVRLRKALYGIKQAGREWYKLLTALTKEKWKRSDSDYCLFTREVNGRHQSLIVYVDDILVTARTKDEVKGVLTPGEVGRSRAKRWRPTSGGRRM